MDGVIDYIYGMDGTGAYFMNTDVVVVSGANVTIPEIVIQGSHVLQNNGTVNTSIGLCAGCRLEIHNSGIFNVNFDLGDGASVVQVVSNTSEAKPIDVNIDYDLHVAGADKIKLSDILHAGKNANDILVRDSFVVWDDVDAGIQKLRLSGDVKLEFNDIKSVIGKSIACEVASDAYVYIVSDEQINPMFELNTYADGGATYVRLERETDYTRFMDKNLGAFVNSLDADVSAFNLRYSLDNAMSVEELDKIVADSMRITPINMMNVVSVLNAMDVNNFDYTTGGGASYTVVGDSYAYGAFLGGGMKIAGVKAGVRGYVNSLSMTDSFDSFSGVVFGGNLYVEYERDYNFVRSMIGGNAARFDITNVFDGMRGVDNPVGYSVYAVTDVGHQYVFDGGFIVSPYVGATVNYMTILNADESGVAGRIGINSAYVFDAFGVTYDYAVRASLNTNNEISLGGSIGFMSDMDMVGGHVAVEFMDNEIGQGYKISAGMNLKF